MPNVPKIYVTVTNDLNQDQRMHRTCNTLTKAGYRVILVGRKLVNSKELPSFDFDTQRLRCVFNKGVAFYLEYNLRLFFYLLFCRFDAILACDTDTILPGLLVAKIKRKPCIHDAHEYFSEVPELQNSPLKKKIWDKLAAWAIPQCKAVYTVGPQLAQILGERYKTPFASIRNVPNIKNRLSPHPTRPVLLYQGALNQGRGLEQMLEAIAELDNVELWIAGSGDLETKLHQLTAQLNLTDKVKFLGFIMPQNLNQLTEKAYIGINLLENNSPSYYYSLANKFFDYIMAEIPSINMNFPEYQHINQQHQVAILIDNLEKETIKEAIIKLISNTQLYEKIVQNCIESKKINNWQKEEVKLIDIWKKAVPL